MVTAAEEPLPTDLDQVSVTVDSGPEVQAEITAADIVFMESQGAEVVISTAKLGYWLMRFESSDAMTTSIHFTCSLRNVTPLM